MKNKNKILFLLIGIVIGAVFAVAGTLLLYSVELQSDYIDKESLQIEKNEDSENDKSIKLSDEEIEELGIVIGEVSSKKLQLHIDLNGEIVPDPYKLAHIIPRFTGVVKKVYKEIGDRVRKEEVIAIIESNESLVTYEVKSSIDGVVLDLHMTAGELIGDDIHAVTIADLSAVWAELNIYQKDLRKIKVGQITEIYFDEVEHAVRGKIFYLSPTVNEQTRTATARVKLNNSRGNWKPGMFVSSRVFTEHVNVDHAIDLKSIQSIEGQNVVFVKDGDGFKPQPVTIGKINSKYAEVLTGLNEGQTYIAQGGFIIKSELLKASFGGDDD
jgi:cobalt-zinc-cadmium efflux system membrane fusion protein